MSDSRRLPLTSQDVAADRLNALRELFPEAFCEGRVDFDRLRQALGDAVDTERERYGLTWAGKSDAIRAIQSQSAGTLKPAPEESVCFDTTENLIVEGDNLEVLKLLQKSYHGRVKMIYIDPPYNIPQTEYILCYLRDAQASSEFGIEYSQDKMGEYRFSDNKGKYRLLRLWHTAPRGAYSRLTLQYELRKPDGRLVDSVTGQWLWSKARMEYEMSQDNIVFVDQSDGSIRAFKKDYLIEGRTEKPTSLFDKATTDDATKEFNFLLPELGESLFPKPTALLKYLLRVSNGKSDLILDFFAGSGTTAQAVLELNREDGGNRRFILVQLPEPTNNPDLPTIGEICKERVRRVIKKLNEADAAKLPMHEAEPDRGFKVFKLTASCFKIWNGAEAAEDADALAAQLAAFADNLQPDARPLDVLFELLLKTGQDLNAKREAILLPSPVLGVPDGFIVRGEGAGGEGSRTVYRVADGALLLCLEPDVTQETLRAMIALKPQAVLVLDTAFHGDDALLTNTELEMQAAGIQFQTV
jgi:adenine-specific DNA-methyltransferase